MPTILKIAVNLQFGLRFQSYKYIFPASFSFRLVSDFKVSLRNILGIFYIVACNYSRLVTDTDYIGIFIVFVDSVLSLLLLLLLLFFLLDTFSAGISSKTTYLMDPELYTKKLHVSGMC